MRRRRLLRNNPWAYLALTAFVFIFGGIDALENGGMMLAVIHFLMAILNIAAASFVKRFPYAISMLLFAFNACFAGFLSWYFTAAGKNRIQYGWALVAVLSVLAMFRISRRARKAKLTAEKES